jgi:hypothetical protein
MKEQYSETTIQIQGGACLVRIHQGDRQGPAVQLSPGTMLDITPAPGVWMSGRYAYDPEHREHYWSYDVAHFVGLVSGMACRVHLTEPAER